MAATRFNMAMVKSGRMTPPILNGGQLHAIGLAMVRRQKERWEKAINAEDRAARPLAKVTAKGKQTFNRNPVRDMHMTGVMRENFTLRKWSMTNIRAENTSRAGRMHARKAQKFENMIGISPSEEKAIFADAYRAYDEYLKRRAWKETRE